MLTTLKLRDPWDDDLDIVSAENVNFAVETAGMGSRFGAALIDLLLQGSVLLLLAWGAVYLLDYLPPMNELSKWVRAFAEGIGILVLVGITHGYSFFFEWLWDGQTPGKRWLGLRVLQTGGSPITAWEALIRSILRTVDFLPVFYGAGAMVAMLNPHNRRIGDLVAGTVVARERHEAGTAHLMDIDAAAEAFLASCAAPITSSTRDPAHAASTPASVGTEDPALATASLQPRTRLNEQDSELLREFFIRRAKLQPAARLHLAYSLAARLCVKVGETAPPKENAEVWLEQLARHLFSTDSLL